MVTIRKTTLNEMNHGRCGTRNNAYYRGATIVWELVLNGEGTEIGFSTKRKAQAVAEFATEINWQGVGDIEAKWEKARQQASTKP